MAADLSLPVREAVVTRLKAFVPLTSLQPPGQIYGERADVTDPPRPFTRYGTPQVLPLRMSCIDGSLIAVDIHTFAEGPYSDLACQIAEQVVKALDGVKLDLGLANGEYAIPRFTGGQTFPDVDEPSNFHAVRTFEIEAVA